MSQNTNICLDWVVMGKKQCLRCTLQVDLYQIIKRENGHVKGMSELGGAQLSESTVSAHSR